MKTKNIKKFILATIVFITGTILTYFMAYLYEYITIDSAKILTGIVGIMIFGVTLGGTVVIIVKTNK